MTAKRYYGYIRIRVPNHPNSVQGWILEHRYVMEQQLGRYLTSDEVVHHKNGNRQDNRLENLQLMKFGEHSSFENSGSGNGNYAREFSIEHRRQISERMKGNIPWNKNAKEKGIVIIPWNKGKKCPQISEAFKGEKHPMYGKKLSEETKLKMSLAGKGRKFTEGHKRKLSEAFKGEKNPMYGKNHSEETRQNISIAGRIIRQRQRQSQILAAQLKNKHIAVVMSAKLQALSKIGVVA